MKLRKISELIIAFVCISTAQQQSVKMDLYEFVKIGIANEPKFKERQFDINKAKSKVNEIRTNAILPKFEVSFAVGPAPEYKINRTLSGIAEESYDFSNLNPFFGTEMKIIQPLNIDKLIYGLKAASLNVALTECDVKKAKVNLSRDLQELYFKYIYAKNMVALATSVQQSLKKATEKVQYALDNDDADISQDDLFELKTWQYSIDDGVYQALYGFNTAKNAIAFCLQDSTFKISDSLLTVRNDSIPSFDKLKKIMIEQHPDLAKLENGIQTRQIMVNIAKGELFPDVFVVGSLKLSKAWGDDDKQEGTDRLLSPYNKKEGALGIGLRFNLNYWSLKNNYVREKNELDALRYKETYATDGLIKELESQYTKVRLYFERQVSAKISVDNADAWMKSAAMKYDLDHSKVKLLTNAYEKSIMANKNYYNAILDYNIAVADLIAKCGLVLDEYTNYVKRY